MNTAATMNACQTWAEVGPFMGAAVGPTGESRRVVTEFVLASVPGTEDSLDTVTETVVTLVTSHHGKAEYLGRPNRVYLSALGYQQRVRFPSYTVSRYGLYTQAEALVQRADGPRYSATTLAHVHDCAIAHLASDYDTNPAFRAVFAEAMERQSNS